MSSDAPAGAAAKGVTLPDALAAAAADIDAALDALLPPVEGDEARLFAAMRHGAMGGKRFRGFLVLEGARQFAVARDAALRTAAAVEMLHAYSLIHDDLPAMDDDALRRGKPTVHVAFDEATAILAGDALQAQAFVVLAAEETHHSGWVRAELCHRLALAAGARGMCGGQMLDMLAAQGSQLAEPAIGRLQLMKTGRLIEFAAEAGAILGKAPPPLRHALSAYGRDLGAAFQIADDILDATATPEQAGKATGKDAAAGKATLVGLLGVERARIHAERLAAQAARHLDSFTEAADLLRQLAAYTVNRRN
jgi:farnesyl diphosphate synthase